MKSEMAGKYIDNNTITMRNGDRMVDTSTAYIAVDSAPTWAEDKTGKMVFDKMTGIFHGDMPQKIADEFIQKMSDDE